MTYKDPSTQNLPIRYKMLFSYSAVFIITIAISSAAIYSIVRSTLKNNIESELKNTSTTIINMVQTSISVSIKNHLRAVAEKNLEMVQHVYSLYQNGEMSEPEAKELAKGILLSQRIGTTGYIACVDSSGTMLLHPREEHVGVDFSSREFIQEMIDRKHGYIEYKWRNPGDSELRPKALFMSYFEPWDWIINASSYRNEFSSLVDIDDFQESILALRFGKTGYAFILDTDGTVVVHPLLQGVNIFQANTLSNKPVKTMLAKKNGQIIYDWKNPGETVARKKLVLFKYLPDYEWIVATSSYLDEFYAPLSRVRNVIVLAVLASLSMVLPITFIISHSITSPLHKLVARLTQDVGDLPNEPSTLPSGDEVDQLTYYFDSFMDRLDASSQNLHQEIAERKQVEAALRESEAKYRSVMEATPDPIIVYDMDGFVTYLNPAFTKVFGWPVQECIGKKLDHFVPAENWEETLKGLKDIADGKMLSSVDTRRYRKDGTLVDVSIRGATYCDRSGELAGSVIIHHDISEVKRLQKEIIDIGDKERQKIGHDLHDDLCPHLIGIEGLGTVLKRKLEARGVPEAEQMQKINDLLKNAVVKSRQFARGLCPVHLVDHGLVAALHELTKNVQSIFGVDCTLRCEANILIRDNAVATHIFRIVQEAVNNAVRHAHSTKIIIRLTHANGRLNLSVSDNGVGVGKEGKHTGMGLRIMAFRATMIQASLEFRKGRNGGTVVHLQTSYPDMVSPVPTEKEPLTKPEKKRMAG